LVLGPIKKLLAALKRRRLHRTYREGRILSRFIARDVQREVLVVSVTELDDGVITARIKTTNLLYERAGLVEKSDFSAPERVPVDRLWKWSGASWGGLPDGTSIVSKMPSQADN
jgi:uncharacterized SAM-dependent methyltransferase